MWRQIAIPTQLSGALDHKHGNPRHGSGGALHPPPYLKRRVVSYSLQLNSIDSFTATSRAGIATVDFPVDDSNSVARAANVGTDMCGGQRPTLTYFVVAIVAADQRGVLEHLAQRQ